MPIGDKTKDTYDKVADYWKKQANKDWAKAKNNPDEGQLYQSAREKYERSKRAREAGEKRFGK
ncbi:MAG: hypothetical protein ACOX89_09405 [Lutispora sp.]